ARGGPEIARVAADIACIADTFGAMPARRGRMDRHRSGVGQRSRRVELDATDDLVTEDERFAQRERTDGAVPVVMQVGAADPAMGVTHQNLTGFGRRPRQVVDSQIASSMNHESLHRCAFRACCSAAAGHSTESMPPSTYTI